MDARTLKKLEALYGARIRNNRSSVKRIAAMAKLSLADAYALQRYVRQGQHSGSVAAETQQETPEREDALIVARRVAQAAQAENKRLREMLAHRREEARAVADAVRMTAPIPAFSVCVPKSTKKVSSRLLFALTDMHIGAVVRKEEMGGRLWYNWDVASSGLRDIIRRVCHWVEVQRGGYKIEDATVLVMGDCVSGGIHDELKSTDEFPPTVATAKAGLLIAECLRDLSMRAGLSVSAHCVGGNHDRIGNKTPSKMTTESGLSFLAYTIAQEALAGCAGVEVEICQDPMPTLGLDGYNIAFMHGHQVKAGGRTPYYGLETAWKYIRDELIFEHGKTAQALFTGHFHHHAVLSDGKIVLCPSLMGPDEWSRQNRFGGSPGQLACLIGEHGVHGTTIFSRRTGRA